MKARVISVRSRRRRSRGPLGVALLRKAFEDLDAEFFRGRPLDLPELIPEPDHFALFLDSHGPPPTDSKDDDSLEQNENKSPAPRARFPHACRLEPFRPSADPSELGIS